MNRQIKSFLRDNADENRAMFDERLVHTRYKIVGIKTKKLEEFASFLAKNGQKVQDFHISCHEEILLAGFSLAKAKCSAEEKIEQFKLLLPYMDNWATTDMIVPRLKRTESQRTFFEKLLTSDQPFYVRSGIIWLKTFALKSDLENVLNLLVEIKHQDYYVKMALAWTYQEALTKDFDFVLNFLKRIEDEFIFLKTISKAIDSFRITSQQKEKLKELRAQTKYRLEK